MPAASGDADGRDAPGALALGGDDAERGRVARISLRGEHRGRSSGMSAGRVLPAAHFRHGRDNLRRGGPQSERIGDQRGVVGAVVISAGGRHPARGEIVGRGRPVERVHRHRALRADGAGSGGRLDAAALAAAGRHGLHVLRHSGDLPAGAGPRQRRRLFPGPDGAPADGAGLCSVAPGGRDRLGGVGALRLAAVLADQPDDFHQPVVHAPGGSAPVPVRGAAGGAPVGSEFSAGPGGRRATGAGPGPTRGGRLRSQHRRRDRGRAGLQPAADPDDRQPVVGADHAHALRPVGGCLPGAATPATVSDAGGDSGRARAPRPCSGRPERCRTGAVTTEDHRTRRGRGAHTAADRESPADAVDHRCLRSFLCHLCPGRLPKRSQSGRNQTAQVRRRLARDPASFRQRHLLSSPSPAAPPARP